MSFEAIIAILTFFGGVYAAFKTGKKRLPAFTVGVGLLAVVFFGGANFFPTILGEFITNLVMAVIGGFGTGLAVITGIMIAFETATGKKVQ